MLALVGSETRLQHLCLAVKELENKALRALMVHCWRRQVCSVTCCGRPNYEKHHAGRKHRHKAAAAAAASAAAAACGMSHGAPMRECDADALLAGLLARGRDPSAQVLLLGLIRLRACCHAAGDPVKTGACVG